MCRPVSGFGAVINGEARVWIGDSDSHGETERQFNLRDSAYGLVAWECFPREDAPSPDTATWEYRLDSEATEGFSRHGGYSADDLALIESAARRACSAFVVRDGAHECKFGRMLAFGSSSVVAWGSSSVVARGSSRVEAWDSSRVEAWDSSSVEARDSSRVEAWGSSRVVARGSSRVEAWGSSSVVARDSSSVVARGSSRVEAWGNSRVEAWGSSSVVARGSSRVEAWGSSRVVALSTYADIVGRSEWDGKGFPVCRCNISVGKTYQMQGSILEERELGEQEKHNG